MAAELLLGHPLFPGETGVDQLVEIIKLLGTPTQAQVDAMNPAYTEFAFPQVRSYPWAKVFKQRAPPEAVDLISRMVSYVSAQATGFPHERRACRHTRCRTPHAADGAPPAPRRASRVGAPLQSRAIFEHVGPSSTREPGRTRAPCVTPNSPRPPPPPPPTLPTHHPTGAGGAHDRHAGVRPPIL